MRPILWGTIWFVIGMMGWIVFSFIWGTGKGLGVEVPTSLTALVYFFGILFYLSLPVSIIAEIICWIRKKRE